MAVSQSHRSTRLTVYSHDAFGLGNTRRTLKICDQLSKEIPDLLQKCVKRLKDDGDTKIGHMLQLAGELLDGERAAA